MKERAPRSETAGRVVKAQGGRNVDGGFLVHALARALVDVLLEITFRWDADAGASSWLAMRLLRNDVSAGSESSEAQGWRITAEGADGSRTQTEMKGEVGKKERRKSGTGRGVDGIEFPSRHSWTSIWAPAGLSVTHPIRPSRQPRGPVKCQRPPSTSVAEYSHLCSSAQLLGTLVSYVSAVCGDNSAAGFSDLLCPLALHIDFGGLIGPIPYVLVLCPHLVCMSAEAPNRNIISCPSRHQGLRIRLLTYI